MKLFRLFYNTMVSKLWLIFLFVGLLYSCGNDSEQSYKGTYEPSYKDINISGYYSTRFLDTIQINDSTYVVNIVYMCHHGGIAAVKIAEFIK